jgi:hypothetical protein
MIVAFIFSPVPKRKGQRNNQAVREIPLKPVYPPDYKKYRVHGKVDDTKVSFIRYGNEGIIALHRQIYAEYKQKGMIINITNISEIPRKE